MLKLSRPRTQKLARLFAFEFAVVVLGVLTAQSVQEYASDRRDHSDMLAQRAHADFQIADLRSTSEYWLKLAPCLSSQMGRVLQAVAANQNPAPADVAKPAYLWSRLSPWGEKSLSTLRRDKGDQVAAHYLSLFEVAAVESDQIWRLASEWPFLALAEPRHGPMESDERAAVRLAALRIQGHLARIVSNSEGVVRRSSALGIASKTVDPLPPLPAHCRADAS
jgi:hypothetical protein